MNRTLDRRTLGSRAYSMSRRFRAWSRRRSRHDRAPSAPVPPPPYCLIARSALPPYSDVTAGLAASIVAIQLPPFAPLAWPHLLPRYRIGRHRQRGGSHYLHR